jgi:hypothetical protein
MRTHSGVSEMCNPTKSAMLHTCDLQRTITDFMKRLTCATDKTIILFGIRHFRRRAWLDGDGYDSAKFRRGYGQR